MRKVNKVNSARGVCVGVVVVAFANMGTTRGAEVPFTEHVISTPADFAVSVFATDMDGDGDTDVLSASFDDNKIAWYENDGGSPPCFTEHVISTTGSGAWSVFATDVNGDGNTDVLSASTNNKIAWYESDGGSPPTFTEHVISTTALNARSVFATDVNGDGDIDVLSASLSDDKSAWYESDGGSPPSFTEHVISTTADNAWSVFATDVNGDGDTDVLSASSFDDSKIAWYESDGGSPPTFTEHVISITADGAVSVFATDVNGDGDTDVLSASRFDDKIAWYESNGGSPPIFTEHVISTTADGAVSVFAMDVDGDGDTDVLSASRNDNKIAWYESDGGSPPSFTERVISTAAIEAQSVFAMDVDGDGDTDVLSASREDDKIAWYEADAFDTEVKITASDGQFDDNFGFSLSIDGDTAIVGVACDDDNGNLSGSAYLYQRDQGGADNWGQVTKITAFDAGAEDQFGFSVAISGDTAIVGANTDDDNGNFSGSAYVHQRDQGGVDNWGHVTKITDGTPGDQFGFSIAISGDTAIVGARDFDCGAGNNCGAAYVYQRDQGGTDNWGLVTQITAFDAAEFDRFSFSVAISGDTAIVGAIGDDDNGSSSGSAYVYQRNEGGANNWGLVRKITASDGAELDDFGSSVAISGDTAIVGATGDDDNGGDSGSAYVYQRDQGGVDNWGQVTKITACDAAALDRFGLSVAISGDTAIVGAKDDDDHGSTSGSAYVYRRDEGGVDNWGQGTKLTASDSAAGDQFGRSVAISGDTKIVGANQDDDNGTDSGSAYLFFAASSCPWDLDGSGIVGATDLLSLLVNWGKCPGCPADFDGNGSVGATDLLALLVNWGPCP